MKETTKLFTVTLLCLTATACSQNRVNVDAVLVESKAIMEMNVDSANFYLDMALEDYKIGVQPVELYNRYSRKVESFETGIDQALNEPNQLLENQIIDEETFKKWISTIDISSLVDKSKFLRENGVDFSTLPKTGNYNLSQVYIDSLNEFSLRFPESWTVMGNYQDYTMMAAGPITNDSSAMYRDGGFGLDVADLDEKLSSTEYYKGNLNGITDTYPDLQILEEKDITLAGQTAKYVAHACTVNGNPVISIQVYFTKGKKGYVLNGTAFQNEFDKYRELYIEIARTLEFKTK